MKKLLTLLAVGTMIVGFKAPAQNFHSINFLAPVSTLTVSNTVQYTNLQSTAVIGTTASTTNIVGLIWTNLLGNQVIAAAGDFTQLSVDVPFWSANNGFPLILASGSNSVWSGAISAMTLNVHILNGGSGANSAVNLTFAPVFDGVHEATASGDRWTVAITANTTSQVNLSTNAPMWKWPGCKALRLETIVNSDTDTSSQVVFDSITLNGFVP